jgi:hypothetical protein
VESAPLSPCRFSRGHGLALVGVVYARPGNQHRPVPAPGRKPRPPPRASGPAGRLQADRNGALAGGIRRCLPRDGQGRSAFAGGQVLPLALVCQRDRRSRLVRRPNDGSHRRRLCLGAPLRCLLQPPGGPAGPRMEHFPAGGKRQTAHWSSFRRSRKGRPFGTRWGRPQISKF